MVTSGLLIADTSGLSVRKLKWANSWTSVLIRTEGWWEPFLSQVALKVPKITPLIRLPELTSDTDLGPWWASLICEKSRWYLWVLISPFGTLSFIVTGLAWAKDLALLKAQETHPQPVRDTRRGSRAFSSRHGDPACTELTPLALMTSQPGLWAPAAVIMMFWSPKWGKHSASPDLNSCSPSWAPHFPFLVIFKTSPNRSYCWCFS